MPSVGIDAAFFGHQTGTSYADSQAMTPVVVPWLAWTIVVTVVGAACLLLGYLHRLERREQKTRTPPTPTFRTAA